MKTLTTLASVAMLALAACGGGSNDDTSTDDDESTVDAAVAVDAVPRADGAIGGDPVGSWALRRVLSTTANAPIVGPTTTTTVTVSRVDIAADGPGFALTDDVCGVALESSSALVSPSFLPGYPATIANATYAGTLDNGALVVPFGVDIIGANLANPDTDPLPTGPDDATVVDEDADGNPGLTVFLQITGLGTVEVYVAQRTESTLRSNSLGDDRISGALETPRFEQVTLDASNNLFTSSPTTAVNAAQSTFTLVRVPAADACADVLAIDELTLFGPR